MMNLPYTMFFFFSLSVAVAAEHLYRVHVLAGCLMSSAGSRGCKSPTVVFLYENQKALCQGR